MKHNLQILLHEQLQRLQKMVAHLMYSHNSIHLPIVLGHEEKMIAYEALSARFSRLQDALIPVFRTLAQLELEHRKSERILDLLNLMEKYRIVESVEKWQQIREMRNTIAHEYWDDDEALAGLLTQVWHDTELLTETVKRLQLYCVREKFIVGEIK
ncbi:MAG: hypothetical protein Q9M28_08335 [Mariprofundaceae bacterium]|nr:hypothetical protein [Mariprofundaceae bacterium]